MYVCSRDASARSRALMSRARAEDPLERHPPMLENPTPRLPKCLPAEESSLQGLSHRRDPNHRIS
jgi:hypothetical protein